MPELRNITFFNESALATTTTTRAWDVDLMSSAVFALSVTSCSGGADTLDVKIQDSMDGTVWFDVAVFTQATAATTERKTLTNFGQFLRAVATLGAGTTAAFTLKGSLHGT